MLVADPLAPLAVASARPRRTRRRLSPGWPLWACLVLYPLWWVLGVGSFAFVVAAVPMGWWLLKNRPLRLPPAYGIWVLFLVWNVASLVMLPMSAPNTINGSLLGRSLSLALRMLDLGACTVFLLYVTNLPKAAVSQTKLVRWMGQLFLVTVAGGLLALAAPHFEFNSLFERVLPHSIASNSYVNVLVHPAAAQNQTVLGEFETPRPAAPWGYTNSWGNNLSLLLVWFCVLMWLPKATARHARLILAVAVALVPVVYSLNRGLWFGLIISVIFVILHLARKGDMRGTMIAAGAIAVGAVLFVATPLNGVIQQRASHGASNDIRAFVDAQSFKGAAASPLLGWGDTRKVIGSAQSIAVGPSPQCPLCGEVNLGSTGEIWQVMFSQGLLGAAIYLAFFGAMWWRLRASPTLVGAAARLICILTAFYTFFYNNVATSLFLSMISFGLACRELVQPDPPTLEVETAAVPALTS